MVLTSTNRLKAYARISLIYLFLIAVAGAFLRFIQFHPITGIDLNYRYLLHGHSHVAFLGWVFNALFILLLTLFEEDLNKTYRIIFWLLQVAVIGMAVSFPLQGYGMISIILSTCHIFLSWFFAFYFIGRSIKIRRSTSEAFVWLGLICMVISALGPFALGFIMAKGLSNTPWYETAIYFYLHFQYNGWFIITLIGVILKYFENKGIRITYPQNWIVLLLAGASVIPLYALSLLWWDAGMYLYGTSLLGAVAQLIGVLYLAYLMVPDFKFAGFQKLPVILTVFAGVLLFLKSIFQVLGSIPALSILFESHHLIIGYLHFVFIGIVTMTILANYYQHGWLAATTLSKTGLIVLITFFLFSEFLLVFPFLSSVTGMQLLDHYLELLFGGAAGMAAAILVIISGSARKLQ